MRILGISNMGEIFRHFENECFYNGAQMPSFVSYYPGKKKDKNYNRMGDLFKKIGKDLKLKRNRRPSVFDEKAHASPEDFKAYSIE